jgi:hypothetical protein
MQIPGLRIPLIRILDASIPALVGLLFLCAPIATRAQQSGGQMPTPPMIPGVSPNPSPEPDPNLRRMTAQMVLKRNAERQQQIVADSAHLLQLAQKLNDEVAKSTKDQLSVSVVKEAEEIEKLAKSIKDKMRDGST